MIFLAFVHEAPPFLSYCLTCGNKTAEIPHLQCRCLEKDYRTALLIRKENAWRNIAQISWIYFMDPSGEELVENAHKGEANCLIEFKVKTSLPL